MVTRASRVRGFTLIEAVMVIAITGIVAAMVAVFIKTGIDSYIESVRRAELTENADVALRRLAREVRLAVPNSLRVKLDSGIYYIEFVPTKDGGRYRNEGDGSSTGSFSALCTGGIINTTFDVLGIMPSVAVGDSIVIYNDASLNSGTICTAPSDVYCGGSRATVASKTASTLTVGTLANEAVICSYPNNRFQVVDQSLRTVTYACPQVSGDLKRYANYAPTAVQATPPSGTPGLVVQQAACAVDYTRNVQQRNGLLYIQLTVKDSSNETIQVFRQIHVDNAP